MTREMKKKKKLANFVKVFGKKGHFIKHKPLILEKSEDLLGFQSLPEECSPSGSDTST